MGEGKVEAKNELKQGGHEGSAAPSVPVKLQLLTTEEPTPKISTAPVKPPSPFWAPTNWQSSSVIVSP